MQSKIHFLGTGGGRINMIAQQRATAGIYLELKGQKIYLDPGPGALIHSLAQKIDLKNLDAILVSHCHIDHTNDAGVLIEAMTHGARTKRGTLAGSVSALDHPDKSITTYHQNQVDKRLILKPGQQFNIGNLKVTTTPTKHTDETGIGFIFHAEKQISYLSDTNYKKQIAEKHKESDIAILNCLYLAWDQKKSDGEPQKHMDVKDAKKFITDINPEIAILQHFGMGMIRYGPSKIAEQIEKQTGIKTIAANDNQIFKGLSRECLY